MEASDIPGFLLRKTSLTIRLRFTPAMACSTRTRSRASLWLASFSVAVSSRPRGFFFLRRQTQLDEQLLQPVQILDRVTAEASLLPPCLPTLLQLGADPSPLPDIVRR